MSLNRNWVFLWGRGVDILKPSVQSHSTSLFQDKGSVTMTISCQRTHCSVWCVRVLMFIFHLHWRFFSEQPQPVQGFAALWGQGMCVAGSPLAQAWVVYHSGLNCLLCTSIYMCNKWGLANYVVLSRNGVSFGSSSVSAHYLQPSYVPNFPVLISNILSHCLQKYTLCLSDHMSIYGLRNTVTVL